MHRITLLLCKTPSEGGEYLLFCTCMPLFLLFNTAKRINSAALWLFEVKSDEMMRKCTQKHNWAKIEKNTFKLKLTKWSHINYSAGYLCSWSHLSLKPTLTTLTFFHVLRPCWKQNKTGALYSWLLFIIYAQTIKQLFCIKHRKNCSVPSLHAVHLSFEVLLGRKRITKLWRF